jgi:hypothetical protein
MPNQFIPLQMSRFHCLCTADICRYGAVNGRLGLAGFMALMKDNMLDAREVLAYLGARPESPTTTRAVIHVSDLQSTCDGYVDRAVDMRLQSPS